MTKTNSRQINLNDNKLTYIKEKLQEMINKGRLSDWYVSYNTNQKYNIYIQSNYKVESILKTKRDEITITVYKKIDEDIGSSSFTINISESLDKFDKELEDAIFICSQSRSKKYELPKADDDIVDDSNIDYDSFYSKKFEKDIKNTNELDLFFEKKIHIFKKLLENESNIKLNYIEFLNNFNKNHIESSKKIKKSSKSNSFYMEFVLSIYDKANDKETEYIVYQDINNLYEFDFERFFKKSITNCKYTISAKEMKDFEGEVILSDKATNDFFNPDLTANPIIAHCGARLKYLGMSRFEKEKEIADFKADKITIYSNPLLKNNLASIPYDDLGISAKKTLLIENGVFKNNFASKQYADYIGTKATGPFGVIEIREGKFDEKELFKPEKGKAIFQIDSFSSFVPDAISGDFSAEIRLGYLIKDGKKIPFKGGLFTGNVFELIKEIRLSKEMINFKGYYGPKHIKFLNGKIVGF